MAPTKTLFTPAEIVSACDEARAAGDDTYSTVFSISSGGRASANGAVRYFDLSCRAGEKVGKLLLRFQREKFVGRIYPLSASDGGATRDPSRTPIAWRPKVC